MTHATALRRDGDLRAHPAADLLPMMSDGEIRALADDIKAHGLLHPIVVLDAGVNGSRGFDSSSALSRRQAA